MYDYTNPQKRTPAEKLQRVARQNKWHRANQFRRKWSDEEVRDEEDFLKSEVDRILAERHEQQTTHTE